MTKPVTICLTMIIKNESKIILRCLESAKSICDYMTICDTGSTDNTCEIVTNFFNENKDKIKGTLHHHEWKNFGYNRTLSLDVGRQSGATYVLCIDADMILEIKPNFKKQDLKADSYAIVQQTSTLFYYNTRLMKSTRKWKCVGVTHEYYDCDKHKQSENLDTLVINDRGDGGCKSDKFERDIKLLTQGLIDEPDNSRYMFYLAQSYCDTNQHEQSIKWYKKRIEMGGWYEEVYYSYYKIGTILQSMGESWEKIEKAYLEAWKYLPSRAEPLYEMAKYCRNTSRYKEGYKYAKIGSTIPFPKNQLLFIFKHVYSFQMLDELAICAYYIGKYHESISLCDRLIKEGHVPENQLSRIKQNMKFSLDKLKELEKEKKNSSKNVVFYIGSSKLENNSMLINLGQEFAKYYDVYIFGKNCDNSKSNGIQFYNSGELENFIKNNGVEIMIIFEYLNYFIQYPINASKTYLWTCDNWNTSLEDATMPNEGKYLIANVIDKLAKVVISNDKIDIKSLGLPENKIITLDAKSENLAREWLKMF